MNIVKSLYISGLIILSAGIAATGANLLRVASENTVLEQRLSKSQDKVILLEAEVVKLNDTIEKQGEEISNLTGRLYDAISGSQYGHDFMDTSDFLDSVLTNLLMEEGWTETQVAVWIEDAFDYYMETGKVKTPSVQ